MTAHLLAHSDGGLRVDLHAPVLLIPAVVAIGIARVVEAAQLQAKHLTRMKSTHFAVHESMMTSTTPQVDRASKP